MKGTCIRMKNKMKKIWLKGTIVDYDKNQKYNIRVQLEDGSNVWVKRDMLLVDDNGSKKLKRVSERTPEPVKLIYFNDLAKYLRYDKRMKKFELVDNVTLESDIHKFWFTESEVGSTLWVDFGTNRIINGVR